MAERKNFFMRKRDFYEELSSSVLSHNNTNEAISRDEMSREEMYTTEENGGEHIE